MPNARVMLLESEDSDTSRKMILIPDDKLDGDAQAEVRHAVGFVRESRLGDFTWAKHVLPELEKFGYREVDLFEGPVWN